MKKKLKNKHKRYPVKEKKEGEKRNEKNNFRNFIFKFINLYKK
jgi:hypothetical protein